MAKKVTKVKKVVVKKESKSNPNEGLQAILEHLSKLDQRLLNLESKMEVLGGVTREYLESQFAKLDEFQKERSQIIKIMDQHESRINSLEGF